MDPVREYSKLRLTSWRGAEASLEELERFIERGHRYYRDTAPRAVVWVPEIDPATGQVSLSDGALFVSDGAVKAATEAGVEFEVIELVSLADLPPGLALRMGHPCDEEAYSSHQGLHPLRVARVPDPVGAPIVIDRRRPSRTGTRLELISTIVQDGLLLVVAVLVRTGVLWVVLHAAAPESVNWAYRAVELLSDFGIVGTVAVHVFFDLAKRITNAWRDFNRD